MRIPRLNSDLVFSKSEAVAIAYPKKTLSTLISAVLLAVCCTSASAGSVSIATESGFLYDESGLTGDVTFEKDGPQNITEIRLEGSASDQLNFSFEPTGDINLVFAENKNSGNKSAIVISGDGELIFLSLVAATLFTLSRELKKIGGKDQLLHMN